MERFYKFIRDSKGFEGMLRDLKGHLLCFYNGSRHKYRPFYYLFTPLLLPFHSPFKTLLLLLISFLTLLPSCDVGDYIGDRFGRWQITTIQTPDTIATPRDLFYDFQAGVHIAHVLYEAEHRTLDLHGLARQEGDSLYIKYLPMDGIGQTMHDFMTRRFLIEDNYSDVRFHILYLDGDKMILERGDRHWELKSY